MSSTTTSDVIGAAVAWRCAQRGLAVALADPGTSGSINPQPPTAGARKG